ATLPRSHPSAGRLLYVDSTEGALSNHWVGELPLLLSPDDLVVVNDAATMPASLQVAGREREVRLLRRGKSDAEWTAVLFGRGDFRVPTEQRPEPAPVAAGDRLDFGGGLNAEVIATRAEERRLIELRFNVEGARLWGLLYERARPVQYAYLQRELP